MEQIKERLETIKKLLSDVDYCFDNDEMSDITFHLDKALNRINDKIDTYNNLKIDKPTQNKDFIVIDYDLLNDNEIAIGYINPIYVGQPVEKELMIDDHLYKWKQVNVIPNQYVGDVFSVSIYEKINQ